MWNGRDPMLKERLFGLTGSEGNHGEDVKEYYFYLDSTPTHSYMKYLYKYPQAEFPYRKLVEENRRRGKDASEYELMDTGVFDEDRYFDIFVEYAKATAEDLLIRSTSSIADPKRRSFICCRPSGFAIRGRGAKRRTSGHDCTGAWMSKTPASSSSAIPNTATAGFSARARLSLLFTENETNGETALRLTERLALCKGWDQRFSSPRRPRRR